MPKASRYKVGKAAANLKKKKDPKSQTEYLRFMELLAQQGDENIDIPDDMDLSPDESEEGGGENRAIRGEDAEDAARIIFEDFASKFIPSDRAESFMRHRACSSWHERCDLLNGIPHSTLALVVNDVEESDRLWMLQYLKRERPGLHGMLLEFISFIQMNKTIFDPLSVYPCVATKAYLDTLPPSARQCSSCGKQMDEGHDIIWKACGKHVFHHDCVRASNAPLTGICDCVARL
jgi:hypothetical protein